MSESLPTNVGWDRPARPRPRFTALLPLTLAFALFAGQPAHAVDEEQPSCRGINLLEEMQGTEAHTRILSVAAETENANALLWKIEADGKPPSYLFGTVHLTDERLSRLTDAQKSALASSRRLVLEVDDLSAGNMARAMIRARGQMVFSDGRRLDHLLSAEEYARVSGILRGAGMPPELAASFRPWVASMMLALSQCEQLRVRRGLLPLDAALAREAQSQGLTIAGLETLEQQLRAMASVPEADQLEILKAGLRTYDRIDDILETMVQLYLGRQLGAIWPLQLALAEKVGVASGAFVSLESSLLLTRNIGMRERAVPHLTEGGAFIAVGALHLPGPMGLVSLLREAGYSVTAVD